MNAIWFLFGISIGLMMTGIFLWVFYAVKRREDQKKWEREEVERLMASEHKELRQ